MNRLNNLQEQLICNTNDNNYLNIKEDNIPIIIDGIRSPITKAFKGGLSKYGPEIILSELLIEIIKRNSFNSFKKMLDKKQLSEETINLENQQINNILMPMGITNENICKKYNISRKEQDEFAYKSHIKAVKAKNKLKKEIINIKDCKKDDCIRENISLESLSKLKPCFVKNGSVTAGNSSPLSDGGALCLLVSLSTLKKYNINKNRILGRIISYVSVGVPPEIMGIGPSVAIPLLLKKNNLKIEDIDLFEINEAFAGQAIYCIKKLKIPESKVNIHGGAIAIGHPLGCSGARLVMSMLNQLKLYNKKRGIVSMCVGTGIGCAALIETYNID